MGHVWQIWSVPLDPRFHRNLFSQFVHTCPNPLSSFLFRRYLTGGVNDRNRRRGSVSEERRGPWDVTVVAFACFYLRLSEAVLGIRLKSVLIETSYLFGSTCVEFSKYLLLAEIFSCQSLNVFCSSSWSFVWSPHFVWKAIFDTLEIYWFEGKAIRRARNW